MAIASSSVSKRNSGATGPKVSSRAISHGRGHVGQHGRLEEACRPGRGACRRSATVAPLATASAMCSSTFSTASIVDQRALRRRRLKPVADLQAPHRRRQLARRRRRRRRPAPGSGWRRRRSGRCCGTWTPSRPATAASRSASSKTMNGALPPSSRRHLLDRAGALRHQQLADLGRAGEGELAHQRVGGQLRRRSRRTPPVTTLNTPGGHAGPLGQLRQRQGREAASAWPA